MTKWCKITEAKYIPQLEAVAPASWSGVGFLKGAAPFDWTLDRHPRFVAYAYVNREHYESVEPLTFPQFRATTPQDVLCNVVADGVVRHRLDPLARLMPRGEFIARDQKTETKKNKGWGQHVEEIRL